MVMALMVWLLLKLNAGLGPCLACGAEHTSHRPQLLVPEHL